MKPHKQGNNMKLLLLLLLVLSGNVFAQNSFDPLLKSTDLTLSNLNLTVTNDGVAVAQTFEWVYHNPIDVSGGGKFYWEYTLGATYGTLSCIGGDWANDNSTLDPNTETGVPFMYATALSDTIYKCANDAGLYFRASGAGGSNIGAQLAFGAGDQVMIALDADTNRYYMGVNGVWNGAQDPALANGPVLALNGYSNYYPAMAVDPTSSASVNAVASYTVPVGFTFLAGGAVINGVCGADDGQALPSTPTNLCTDGNPSVVSGTGPWTWDCVGLLGGSTANCSANLNGGFVPFPASNPPSNSITAKGNILTSDGTNQIEFPACAVNEVLIFDPAEVSGMKCGAN